MRDPMFPSVIRCIKTVLLFSIVVFVVLCVFSISNSDPGELLYLGGLSLAAGCLFLFITTLMRNKK